MPYISAITALIGVPLAIVWACARCVDEITSSGSSAAHTPRRDRLLPDRDVQEAGQLAGAEALLDLLLEAADHEHLAEELAQALIGECRRASRVCSPSTWVTGVIMLIGR